MKSLLNRLIFHCFASLPASLLFVMGVSADDALVAKAKQTGQIKGGLIPVLIELRQSNQADETRRGNVSSARTAAEIAAGGSELVSKFKEVMGGAKNRSGAALTADGLRPSLRSERAATLLGVANARLTEGEINLLESNGFVVSLDPRVYVEKPPELQRVARSSASGPTGSLTLINVPKAWQKATGKGVVVAVVDTGVANHPAIRDRLLAGINTVGGSGTGDLHGHGSHVAGTIAAGKTTGVGVAFNARILPVKVLDDNGSGTLGDVSDGIVESVLLPQPPQVISISIQINEQLSGSEEKIWNGAVATATKANIPVILAAGNNGTDGQSALVIADDAIVVGAVDNQGSAAPFTGSNPNGPKPDLSGPGVNVLSLSHTDSGFVMMSGTSMATPHLAGVVALALECNPRLSVEGVRRLLLNSLLDGNSGIKGVTGAGIVDASKVVRDCAENPVTDDKGENDDNRSQNLARIRALIDKKHAETVKDLNDRANYWINKYNLTFE